MVWHTHAASRKLMSACPPAAATSDSHAGQEDQGIRLLLTPPARSGSSTRLPSVQVAAHNFHSGATQAVISSSDLPPRSAVLACQFQEGMTTWSVHSGVPAINQRSR